jgi:hypothetical protein
MNRALAALVAASVMLAGISACVISDPSPYAHGVLQPGFNKAWNNAIDAMKDEGVEVTLADLAAGRLEGRRGGITIEALVVTRKLGDVRATFSAEGAVAQDPGLAERVERRYDARMAK